MQTKYLHADWGSHVEQHPGSGYCRNVLYAFKRFLFSIQLQLLTFYHFFVFDMASDNGDAVATQLVHGKGGSTSATDCFVERKTVPHRDVAKYGKLYPNKLDAKRFGTLFSDGQNSTVFERLAVRRNTDIGAWN